MNPVLGDPIGVDHFWGWHLRVRCCPCIIECIISTSTFTFLLQNSMYQITHIWESRRFESMYTMRGKPDQHATHIPHSVRVWLLTIHISRSQHIATFCVVINRFKQIHYPWEEGLPSQSTTRWLTNPYVRTQLLSYNSQWSSGEKISFCWQLATTLTGPISLVCDQYVQYLLAGTNSLVLNRHRWWLQP
jgi:hypothetical protein